MTENTPIIQTVHFVVAFFVFYVVYLARKTINNSIDIFDFVVLSSVGLLPTLLMLFPDESKQMTAAIGVAFPFVILFGLLFFIVFIYLAYLTSRIHKLRRTEIRLVQEISLLKEETSSQHTKV